MHKFWLIAGIATLLLAPLFFFLSTQTAGTLSTLWLLKGCLDVVVGGLFLLKARNQGTTKTTGPA